MSKQHNELLHSTNDEQTRQRTCCMMQNVPAPDGGRCRPFSIITCTPSLDTLDLAHTYTQASTHTHMSGLHCFWSSRKSMVPSRTCVRLQERALVRMLAYLANAAGAGCIAGGGEAACALAPRGVCAHICTQGSVRDKSAALLVAAL